MWFLGRMERSPRVPATQSAAVVQGFPAFSCEPAISCKQIITGIWKVFFRVTPRDRRQMIDNVGTANLNVPPNHTQILCNYLYPPALLNAAHSGFAQIHIFGISPCLFHNFTTHAGFCSIDFLLREGRKRKKDSFIFFTTEQNERRVLHFIWVIKF